MSEVRNLFQAHPWHGIKTGDDAPRIVNAFVEIVPTDTVKYEIDKDSGHLKVDRPQKYSNLCPALYGFVPQTYCGKAVGEFCAKASGKDVQFGDRDPLDILILTEKPIQHGNVLVRAMPIGGLRMIERGEADDKIIAVLAGDEVYGIWQDISDCPKNLLDRLQHYFLTYKDMPGSEPRKVEIDACYGRNEAHQVILKAQEDYSLL